MRLVGTQIGAQSVSPSLNVAFGNVVPGETKVARWLLTSSLEGQFTRYSASLQHTDGLGELHPSLITGLEIHEMAHVVRADEPADDGLPDFLANDVVDAGGLPDRLHTSDGAVLPIAAITAAAVSGAPTPSSPTVTVNAAMPSGWAYLRIPDPGGAGYRLTRVLRADGSEVRFGDNAWQTHRIARPAGQPEHAEDFVHLIDRDGSGAYTLVYEPILTTPDPVSIGARTSNTIQIDALTGANAAAVEHAVRDLRSGLYVGADGTLVSLPFWQPRVAWERVVVRALTPSTQYRFSAKARAGGVETPGSVSLWPWARTSIPGDADGDGAVTKLDGILVESAIGTVYGDPDFDPRADLDGDGAVTKDDVELIGKGAR